jgi:hypothetical protein
MNKKEEAISVMLVELKYKLLQAAMAAVVVAVLVLVLVVLIISLQCSGQKKMLQQILLKN